MNDVLWIIVEVVWRIVKSICNNIVLYNYSIHDQAEQKSVYNHTTMKHMPILL